MVRAAIVLGVSAAEVLAFSLCFDVQPLIENDVPLFRIAGHGTAIFRVLAGAVVALVLIERRRVPAALGRWAELAATNHAFSWAFAAHLVLAGWFAVLSSTILQGNGATASAWQLWLWVLAGIAAFVAWILALAPVRFWSGLLNYRSGLVLTASLLAGAAIYCLGLMARRLWIPLSDVTMTVCARLLSLVSDDVVCKTDQRILGTDGFNVHIAPVCSGYEGIGLMVAAFVLFVCMFRRELRFPHVLLLLPLGIVAIWLSNAVRIVVLILLGAHVSPQMAIGAFHSQAGWIAFAAITLALCAVALRTPWFTKMASPSADLQTSSTGIAANPTAAYLIPLMTLIAGSMVAAAFSTGFDWLYPAKMAATAATIWFFRASYRHIAWGWSWTAAANGVVVFALWMVLEPLMTHSDASITGGLSSMPRSWAGAWVAVRVLGSVLVVPSVEELAFRGYLMRRFMSRDFERASYRSATWLAIAVSSVLFGLLHGRWIAGSVAGVAYALAARNRNQLSDAILAHAITNALIAIYVLATGSWFLWT